MRVALHPRAAPADRVKVRVGIFGRKAFPTPPWTLDGGAGYGLTPGLESGAGYPEVVWRAARCRHQDRGDQESVPIAGSFAADHRIG